MTLRLSALFLLVIAIALAGCTDAPSDGGDDAERPEGADGGDGSARGPFEGVTPGVQEVPLAAGTAGTIAGHVYDVTTGMPIDDGLVLVSCSRQMLPGTDTSPATTASPTPTPRIVDVASDGSFTLDDPLAFTDCERIEYTIQAPGYTMKVPLGSGPVLPGAAYVINGGMVPER